MSTFVSRFNASRRFLLVLCIAAFAATLVVIPRADDLRLNQDFPLYNAAAGHLLSGDLLIPDFGRNAPGWPVYLAFLYLWFGSSEAVLVISQIFLHVCLITLTYFLAKEVSTDEHVPWVAALAAAVWPSFLFQLRHGSSPLLYAVVFLSAIFFLVRAVKLRSPWRGAVGGVLLGFAALIDVVALFVPPVFVLWVLIDGVRLRSKIGAFLKRLIVVIIACIAAALIIIPWTYRNLIVFKDFSVAPIIAKSEQNYFKPENIQKITRTLMVTDKQLLLESLIRIFVFPVGIHTLDGGATFSYKERLVEIIFGRQSILDLTPEQIKIFATKIFLTIIHLSVLIGAVVTIARYHARGLSSLVLLLVLYVVIAVTTTAALSNFDAITLANGFLAPLMPLLIIFATEGYISRVRMHGKFSFRDVV